MNTLSLSLSASLFASIAFTAGPTHAGSASAGKSVATETTSSLENSSDSSINWLTGEGVSLGGLLFPHIHTSALYGESDGDLERLSLGHHDPKEDGWNFTQAFEFGLSGRFHQHFQAFGNMALSRTDEGEWEHHFEEWFGKIVEIPGGFELRGGRYYNRFGLQNASHPHGWNLIDQNLVNARFLGDDSLASTGAELSWTLPTSWTSVLSFSVGEAVQEEGHEHGEGEEEEGHEEAHLYHAEEAAFTDTLFALNWTNVYDYNDFHQIRAGVAGAWGDNAWGELSSVYGLHLEYQWRENGYSAGGSSFRWRSELMWRDIDALAEETETRGSFDEFGLSSTLTYALPTSFAGPLETSLRADYVEGVKEADLDERFRLSPSVRLYLNSARTAHFGGQVNCDWSEEHGSDTSWWLSFGLDWGGAEVR